MTQASTGQGSDRSVLIAYHRRGCVSKLTHCTGKEKAYGLRINQIEGLPDGSGQRRKLQRAKALAVPFSSPGVGVEVPKTSPKSSPEPGAPAPSRRTTTMRRQRPQHFLRKLPFFAPRFLERG